jgi:DNA transformation protein
MVAIISGRRRCDTAPNQTSPSTGETAMPSANKDFALYCCDLLAVVGRCEARRMFGGWGISSDGLTFALMTDLGAGDTLWLKADEDTRAQFEQAGCERFTYPVKGELKSMNYYAAPADAMESPALMAPWARLAFEAALKAQNAKLAKSSKTSRKKPAPLAAPAKSAKVVAPRKPGKPR